MIFRCLLILPIFSFLFILWVYIEVISHAITKYWERKLNQGLSTSGALMMFNGWGSSQGGWYHVIYFIPCGPKGFKSYIEFTHGIKQFHGYASTSHIEGTENESHPKPLLQWRVGLALALSSEEHLPKMKIRVQLVELYFLF